MLFRLSSRRARRRLIWLGVVVVIGGAVALAVAFFPNTEQKLPSGPSAGSSGNPPAVGLSVEKQVPVNPADRREINALLDRFVPLAVERKDPVAARALVTPDLRNGATLADWRRGSIPGVYPYEPRGTTFHSWTVSLSFRNEVDLDLLLQPLHPEKIGAAVLRFYLKRLHGRWLIDSSYPVEVQQPQGGSSSQAAPAIPKTLEHRTSDDLKPRLSALWFIVPGAVVGLLVLLPLLIFGFRWYQHRRAAREWQAHTPGN